MEDTKTKTETTALTTSESAPPINIDLPQLETEIKDYLKQTTQNFIEIGKRLIQAKSLVPHGQWQDWLENNFQFTKRRAQQFMQCAERFGKNEIDFAFPSTKMIALLSLPEADTEKFIEQKKATGTPISDMSVKTLRKEIKQWKSETEKISPVQPSENKNIETIDITPVDSQQNQNTTEQTIPNKPDDTPLDNLNLVSTEPSYPEPQQPNNESTNEFNEQESFIPESPVEIPETSLIEKLSNMSSSLIQKENRKEIIQNFAKNNPSKLNIVIQNLTDIISELKALSQKE